MFSNIKKCDGVSSAGLTLTFNANAAFLAYSIKPDYIAKDLLDAGKWIIDYY